MIVGSPAELVLAAWSINHQGQARLRQRRGIRADRRGQQAVATACARVTRRRMDALRRISTELGMEPAEVATRAWLAYAFHIGHHQLRKNPEIAARQPARIDRMAALPTGGRNS